MRTQYLGKFRISDFGFRICRRGEVIGLIEACCPRLGDSLPREDAKHLQWTRVVPEAGPKIRNPKSEIRNKKRPAPKSGAWLIVKSATQSNGGNGRGMKGSNAGAIEK